MGEIFDMNCLKEMIQEVTEYYTRKLREFGPTPKGVDWNSKESQEMRFQQLLKLVDTYEGDFTILDYGCGYGSLYDYMRKRYPQFVYIGYDSSREMIDQAKKLYGTKGMIWLQSLETMERVDFVIASGIFNVKLHYSEEQWSQYLLKTLNHFDGLCSKGFSFNVLTKYSDKEHMKTDLFYADPCFLFNYCKQNISKKISLIHDYPLYEFTLIVRK